MISSDVRQKITVRKGQRWRCLKEPHQVVVVYQKGYRGGWDVLTTVGRGTMHNMTEWTLNRFYQLIEKP